MWLGFPTQYFIFSLFLRVCLVCLVCLLCVFLRLIYFNLFASNPLDLCLTFSGLISNFSLNALHRSWRVRTNYSFQLKCFSTKKFHRRRRAFEAFIERLTNCLKIRYVNLQHSKRYFKVVGTREIVFVTRFISSFIVITSRKLLC